MKVSYNWLKNLLKFNKTPEELADILTMNFAEATVKNLGKRPVLDIELGSNQVGWASGHLSLAQEIGACLGKKFNFPNIKNIFQIHHAPKNLNNCAKNILLLDSVKIDPFNSLLKPYKIENLLTEILKILK